MTELKPCPFCGGKYTQVRYIGWESPSAFDSGYRTECCDCGVITAAYPTEEEAAAAWNTRTDYHGYEQAAIEAWKSIKKWNTRHVETCKLRELDALTQTLSMVNGCAWGECSECGCLTPDDSTYCINCGRKVVSE